MQSPHLISSCLCCVFLILTGGTPMDVLDYFKTNPIVLESDYRQYDGKVGECAEPERSATKFISPGWKGIGKPCTSGACTQQWRIELDMLKEMAANKQALMVYVDASQWQNYAKGKSINTQFSLFCHRCAVH